MEAGGVRVGRCNPSRAARWPIYSYAGLGSVRDAHSRINIKQTKNSLISLNWSHVSFLYILHRLQYQAQQKATKVGLKGWKGNVDDSSCIRGRTPIIRTSVMLPRMYIRIGHCFWLLGLTDFYHSPSKPSSPPPSSASSSSKVIPVVPPLPFYFY